MSLHAFARPLITLVGVASLSFVVLYRPAVAAADDGEKRTYAVTRPAWDVDAAAAGLSPAVIAALREQKVVVAGRPFLQVFEPYARPEVGVGDAPARPAPRGRDAELPHFVTSDSVLAGYHALLESSVARLERANARRLGVAMAYAWRYLRTVDRQVKGRPDIARDGVRRARVAVGVATRLLGGATDGADPATAALVDAEVARVQAAAVTAPPAWSTTAGGRPAPGAVHIDYTRARPRGFYDGSDPLRRYFRATAWLQAVPLRVADDDADLLAAMLVASAFRPGNAAAAADERLAGRLGEVASSLHRLVGPPAVPDVLALLGTAPDATHREAYDLADAEDWPRLRREVVARARAARARSERLADPERFGNIFGEPAPPPAARPEPPVVYRVLAARTVPETLVFRATTEAALPGRAMPTGLEVLVALGSPFAAEAGKGAPAWDEVVRAIGEANLPLVPAEKELDGTTLYRQYLHAIAALHDDPEPDAPAFMKGEAWRAKQAQAALAGWAQLRHTWVLQAKESVSLFGGPPVRAGFVEPVPEFYARLAGLAERSGRAFAAQPGIDGVADRLRSAVAAAERADLPASRGRGWRSVAEDERRPLQSYLYLALIAPSPEKPDEPPGDDAWAAGVAGVLSKLREELARLDAGDPPAKLVAEVFGEGGPDAAEQWHRLATICRTLEVLAHKQLRGRPLSERDDRFIEGYGRSLAELMGYPGDAYLTPQDDAAKVADVHTATRTSEVLEVAVGRPRAIFVLYPWDGQEVLCRGAVLPYHEFALPGRITDVEWRAKLDAGRKPQVPRWARLLYR